MFIGDEVLDAWTIDGRPAGKQPRRVIGALGLSTTPPGVTSMPGLDAVVAPPSTGPTMPTGPMAGGMAASPPDAVSGADAAALPSSTQPLPPPAPASDVAGTRAQPSPGSVSPAGAGGTSSPKVEKLKPVTNAELSAAGTAGGYNAIADANAEQAGAAAKTAEAEADGLIKQAVAQEERNAAVNAILVKRQQDAAANLKRINDKSLALGQAREKWANTKIDRKADHPILAAISVALGAIGSAMTGKNDGSNPALDMLFKSIDRKVAGQMADLDKAGKALDMRKEEIGELRTHASDQLAMHNLAISAESEKAARQVEAIMARSNSDVVKAKGAEIVAAIRAKGAEAYSNAVSQSVAADERAEERKQRALEHRQNLGLQYSRLAEDRRQSDRNFKEGQRQFDANYGLRAAELAQAERAAVEKARATGGEEAAKRTAEQQKMDREQGVVVNGEAILQPEGQDLIKQAQAKLDEAAAIEARGGFGAKASAMVLRAQADQMKGEASKHRFYVADKKEKEEIGKLIANTQLAITTAEEIKQIFQRSGKSWVGTSDGEKRMRSLAALLDLQTKDVFELGALDKGSEAYLRRVTGGDPAKVDINVITGMLGNSDAPDAMLDALSDTLERKAQLRLGVAGDGYRGTYKFSRPTPQKLNTAEEAAVQIRSQKTSGERLEANEPNTARKVVETAVPVIGNVLQSRRENADAAAAADGSTKYFGFTKKQEPYVDNLVKMNAAGGSAAKQARPILLGMASDPNPNIRAHSLRLLKEHAPDLYQQAISKLPADERQQQEDFAAARKNIMQQVRR